MKTKKHHVSGSSHSPQLPQQSRISQIVGAPTQFRLTLEYPSRSLIGRVGTIRIRLEPVHPVLEFLDIHPDLAYPPVHVRLVVAGALTTPAEVLLQPSSTGPIETTIAFTPLAHGRLNGQLELEVDGGTEILPLNLRSDHQGLLIRLLGLVILLTALLHGIAQSADDVPSWVGRQMQAWLPPPVTTESLGLRIGSILGQAARWLAAYHLSFFGCAVGLLVTVGIFLLRRPYRLQTSSAVVANPVQLSRTTSPSEYLTPVSLSEIHAAR
jgi:hypothetical protein